MNQIENRSKRLFISFEGIDFSGKSTMAAMLSEELSRRGFDTVVTRDPPYALSPWERLRENDERDKLAKISEAFLFLAARLDNYERIISPKLQQGGIVIADRFIDSWFAYQSVRLSRHFGNEELALKFLLELNLQLIDRGLLSFPEKTLFIDTDPSIAITRKVLRSGEVSKYEDIDIQERVFAQYHKLAKMFPNRFRIVDARGKDLSRVYEDAKEIVLEAISDNLSRKEASHEELYSSE